MNIETFGKRLRLLGGSYSFAVDTRPDHFRVTVLNVSGYGGCSFDPSLEKAMEEALARAEVVLKDSVLK